MIRFVRKILVIVLVIMPAICLSEALQEELQSEALAAIRGGNETKVDELIGKGLNPNYELGQVDNVMFRAVSDRQADIFLSLLESGGDPDHRLSNGLPFLYFVLSRLNSDAAIAAVEKGIDLNEVDRFSASTVFSAVATITDYKLLKVMLSKGGADPNTIPPEGHSALYWIYKNKGCGNACVRLMLENCASPDSVIEGRSKETFREYVSEDTKVVRIIEEVSCSLNGSGLQVFGEV